jgi:hypothetical protein
MDIIKENEILEEVRHSYNQSPLGFRIYCGLSHTGHPEILIASPSRNWMIKRDSPYSGKWGIGGRLDDKLEYADPILTKAGDSGIRPVPNYLMEKMANLDRMGVDVTDTNIIDSLLKQPPATFDELRKTRPPVVLEGPVIDLGRPLQSIIRGQLELDMALEAELKKWENLGYIG